MQLTRNVRYDAHTAELCTAIGLPSVALVHYLLCAVIASSSSMCQKISSRSHLNNAQIHVIMQDYRVVLCIANMWHIAECWLWKKFPCMFGACSSILRYVPLSREAPNNAVFDETERFTGILQSIFLETVHLSRPSACIY
ncbi:hypothetical protein MRX96_027255 [Rhipicephalus microplus]